MWAAQIASAAPAIAAVVVAVVLGAAALAQSTWLTVASPLGTGIAAREWMRARCRRSVAQAVVSAPAPVAALAPDHAAASAAPAAVPALGSSSSEVSSP